MSNEISVNGELPLKKRHFLIWQNRASRARFYIFAPWIKSVYEF